MRHVRDLGAAALLVCWLAAALVAPVQAHAQEAQFNQAQLIRGLLPTVVNIIAHANAAAPKATMNAAAQSQSFQLKSSAGSGFIVDPTGLIVTNWHVVDQAYAIYVTFSDGTRVEAKVLNAARILDIALLKVDVGHPLPAAKWGDSNTIEIGDPVLAIGNPLGIGESVTAGIVSALNRNIQDTPYDDFIQTDASINHGNSGGPLFDLKGEVIGITTALVSPTSANAGLGFAIPSAIAKEVINRLQTYGWVRPGFLGVKVQQMTPEMAQGMGLTEPQGSIVAWVTEGGPAAAAGLQIGDIVARFDDVIPTDERDLLRMIARSVPGRKVTLGVLRDGKPIDVAVTLGEWPRMAWEERDAPTLVASPHWNVPPDLGVQLAAMTPQLAAENDIPSHPVGTKAALVTGVAPDSDAARRGISVGDLVLQVGETKVETQAEWLQALADARKSGRAFVMVLVLPKTPSEGDMKFRAPKWVAVRASDG
jgi:serine protease Do